MKYIILLIIVLLAIPSLTLLVAQNSADPLQYNLTSPVPGGNGDEVTGGFTQYIEFLFPFMLSIAAIAALVMFVYGGIEYAASGGSEDRIRTAKDRIQSALLGLLLAVGSVVILQTINPELVKLNFNLRPVPQIAAPPDTTPGPGGNPVNATCSNHGDCASNLCLQPPSRAVEDGMLCAPVNLPSRTPCTDDRQCASGNCNLPGPDIAPFGKRGTCI